MSYLPGARVGLCLGFMEVEMTPVQEAICRVINECGGWPKSDSQMSRIEGAMRKCSVHTFSVSWHSVTVDRYTVMQQEYRQWEQGL